MIASIHIPDQDQLSIDQFKEMDYRAISEYSLPIELMMENAGLLLAKLITSHVSSKHSILFGIGVGNNGGGGLVAARRLSGWGYDVYLNIPNVQLNPLPAAQLKRAIAFGALMDTSRQADVFVDAYFGFSQRLPLPLVYLDPLKLANSSRALKISLDLPSGFDKKTGSSFFKPAWNPPST